MKTTPDDLTLDLDALRREVEDGAGKIVFEEEMEPTDKESMMKTADEQREEITQLARAYIKHHSDASCVKANGEPQTGCLIELRDLIEQAIASALTAAQTEAVRRIEAIDERYYIGVGEGEFIKRKHAIAAVKGEEGNGY